MKHVTVEELTRLVTVLEKEPMTRNQKLQRWAEIVGRYPSALRLLNDLEYYTPNQLAAARVHMTGTAMELAAVDPTLQAEGLDKDPTIKDVMNFFEISQGELHEFSCDCGGWIDNKRQADRILNMIK